MMKDMLQTFEKVHELYTDVYHMKQSAIKAVKTKAQKPRGSPYTPP